MKAIFLVSAVVFCFISIPFKSIAQTIGSDPFAGVITWKTGIDKTGYLKMGDIVTLTLEATLQKGFHIFSSTPPKKDANLPTIIEYAPQFIGFKPEGKIIEEGKLVKEFDDVFNTEVRYYKDKVVFKHKYIVNASKCLLSGYIKYQICDEGSRCVAQSQPFEFKVIAP